VSGRLREIRAPFIAAAPSGARVRTRLRVSPRDAAVLEAAGRHLGSLAGRDLAARCAEGRLDAAGRAVSRRGRKQALTARASSRWAGAVTRASEDAWQLADRNLRAERQALRARIRVIEARLAIPTHVDLRPVQAGGPPVWIGGASEAAMRRVGRSGVGWLAFERLPDEVVDSLWSIARHAAEDAGRDPDALKMAMRINLEPDVSVDSLADKLKRLAESGTDEAFVDTFAVFPSLDQALGFASQLMARTGRL
jgi:hypothetical protein